MAEGQAGGSKKEAAPTGRHAPPSEPATEEIFHGIIKSYNVRRGFGFVACEETARRFGRDVYLSKDEVMALAKESAVGESAAATEGSAPTGPLVKEGDYLLFRVQRSTEGFPQAVHARRIRRLKGVVLRASDKGKDGAIRVTEAEGGAEGEAGKSDAEGATSATTQSNLVGAEVRVRQSDCGLLRLVPNDEVAFCCTNASDVGAPQGLEAQLIELLRTDRGTGSLLGCFSLDLPRTPEAPAEDAESNGKEPAEAKTPAAPAVPGPSVVLDGHALVDRVVLSGLPSDMDVPELMRFFSKIGATEAVVAHPDSRSAGVTGSLGFASVTFAGPADVARLLARVAHTISEQGATQLARLGPCRAGHDRGTLPALSMPALSMAEGGALLAQWSQVSLAAGYLVEFRPAGGGTWSAVAAAAGRLDDPTGSLPPGLLGPQCSACKVNSCRTDVSYEARITYYAECGCHSQVSAPSAPCAVLAPPPQQVPELLAPTLAGPLGAASDGLPGGMPLPPTVPSGVTWRCVHGALVPEPAAPEMLPYDEAIGRSVVIQWPVVIQATAYTVDLLQDGAAVPERFTRHVPESLSGTLVEFRVNKLQPSGYAACVRCVAACGCESVPSHWSYLPPAWPPMSAPPLGGAGWSGHSAFGACPPCGYDWRRWQEGPPAAPAGAFPPATAPPAATGPVPLQSLPAALPPPPAAEAGPPAMPWELFPTAPQPAAAQAGPPSAMPWDLFPAAPQPTAAQATVPVPLQPLPATLPPPPAVEAPLALPTAAPGGALLATAASTGAAPAPVAPPFFAPAEEEALLLD